MAGGMYPRRDRPTLAERKVISERIEANRAATTQHTPATDRPDSAGHRRGEVTSWPGGRHCWVIAEDGSRSPGVLIEWKSQNGIWFGLVAFVTDLGEGRPAMAVSWLDARVLRPAP